MTPTIEEVKRVADECGMHTGTARTVDGVLCYYAIPQQLQAFAQHWIEVGRKEQREKDVVLFESDPSMENFQFIAEAIRDNTGE